MFRLGEDDTIGQERALKEQQVAAALRAQAAAQAAALAATKAKLKKREKLKRVKKSERGPAVPVVVPRKPVPPLPVKPAGPPAGAGGGSDVVNLDILSRVKQRFMSADTDDSGELDPSEFSSAFMGILQTEDGGDARALAKLFMRIDANSDGTVSWDEFSSYMLLESQGSASIREFEGSITFEAGILPRPPDHHSHSNLMMHMAHMRLHNGSDRYVSCAKDGCVKIWNAKDLKLVKTLSAGTSWVTCTKLMPLSQTLAVASFSRSLKIFDLASYEQCGVIHDMESAPLCMDVWVPSKRRDCEMVVLGDVGGMVRCYSVAQGSGEDKSDRFVETPHWKFQHHTDWVTRVKYVEDLNSVIAASLDRTVSIIDVEARLPVKRLEGHHTKGVNAVDWSSIYKFVATCSQDRRIMLWNPFSQKPLAILTGHTTSVTDVIVNDRDNQIISLAADKTMKVWDIRNHKCLQTVIDKEVYPLGDYVAAMAYDVPRKTLVTGNTHPKVWRQKTRGADKTAHLSPVTRVIFNSLFQEAVTGDQNGTISVWHVPTGKLRFRFYKVHGNSRLTALNFDTNKRRLITGSEDGDVKVWNFSSGACLCEMKSNSKTEVTAVTTVRGLLAKHVLAAGWDRKITFYEDASSNKEVGPGRIIHGHSADILSMATMEGSPTLATSSDDGLICTWNVESGASRKVMKAALLETLPSNERAVEALAFLSGRLKHILISVGADRMMRFWNVTEGECVLEVFTGHRMGETVQALAADSQNELIATGDSAGFMKVWNISGFEAALAETAAASAAAPPAVAAPVPSRLTPPSPVTTPSNQQAAVDQPQRRVRGALDRSLSRSASRKQITTDIGTPQPSASGVNAARAVAIAAALMTTSVVELVLWRGHEKHVTGLDWTRGLETVQASFLLSSSSDCTIRIWNSSGVQVGQFGQAQWQLHEQPTWSSQEKQALTEGDAWVMDASRTPPGEQNERSVALRSVLRRQFTFGPASFKLPGTESMDPPSGSRSGHPLPDSTPLPGSRQILDLTPNMSIGSRPSTTPGVMQRRGEGGALLDSTFGSRSRTPSAPRPTTGGRVAWTGEVDGGAGDSSWRSAAGADQPSVLSYHDGPEGTKERDRAKLSAQVALVCEASYLQRAERIGILRSQRQASMPGTPSNLSGSTAFASPRDTLAPNLHLDALSLDQDEGGALTHKAKNLDVTNPSLASAALSSLLNSKLSDKVESLLGRSQQVPVGQLKPSMLSQAVSFRTHGQIPAGGENLHSDGLAPVILPPSLRLPQRRDTVSAELDPMRRLNSARSVGRHTEIMSDSSSDHDSDSEIPASLWLSEFSQMRKGKDPGEVSGGTRGRVGHGGDSIMRVKLTKLLGSHRVMAPGLDTGYPQGMPVSGTGPWGGGGSRAGAAAVAMASAAAGPSVGGGGSRGGASGRGEGKKRASSAAGPVAVRQAGGILAPSGGGAGSSTNGA